MSDEEASAPPAADAPVDPKPEDAPENGDSAAPPAENGDAVVTKDTVRLYLGNLSYETDESKLRNIFSEFGEVTDVFLPSDRMSGRPRGEWSSSCRSLLPPIRSNNYHSLFIYCEPLIYSFIHHSI